jgi:cytochrome o ubiquinol oxidase operon protein cyoD
MSNRSHNNSGEHEHGTMASYVIGFVLSVILTVIPYALVVKQTVSGTALLFTIFGFAMAQMIIQITFFLHLGRGPKPKWNLIFFISTVGIILIVVGGSIVIINNLHYNMQPSDQIKKLINDEGIYQVGGQLTGACQGQHANLQVIIQNAQPTPEHTDAQKCDTLTFIDEDNVEREIVFGLSPQHVTYAGETQLIIRRGQAQTVNLSESGTYQFHDQLHEETAGSFSVAP